MITLAIVAILLALGVPAFRDFVAGQRIRMASYDISYALTYARSEAIKRNGEVDVNPEADGWQSGWRITAGAATLSEHEAFSGLTITGPTDKVTFSSNGRLKTAASPFGISSSASSSASPRCVSINLSGLPSSKAGGC